MRALLVLMAAISLGGCKQDVANVFYKQGPAPWETVDAFYYPQRGNRDRFEAAWDLASVDECRSRARGFAILANDPAMIRGLYECGVGLTERMAGNIRVYRLVVR